LVPKDKRRTRPPEPRHQIGVSYYSFKPIRHAAQHLISHIVAEAVVHLLKVVQIKIQQSASTFLLNQPLQLFVQSSPVREPGERIVRCLVSKFLLSPLLFSHIPEDPKPPKVRSVLARDRSAVSVDPPPIRELNEVATTFVGMIVEIFDLLSKFLGTGKQFSDGFEKNPIEGNFGRRPIHELFRDVPDFKEAIVVERNISFVINDEQAVDRGLGLRLKQGLTTGQLPLPAFALGDVRHDAIVKLYRAVFVPDDRPSKTSCKRRSVFPLKFNLHGPKFSLLLCLRPHSLASGWVIV